MASNLSLSSTSRIELLSRDNYDTWIIQVQAWLKRSGLWKYVDGSQVKPERGTSAASTEAIQSWIEKDDMAKTELILSMQPRLLKDIKNCVSSRDIWLKLQRIHASTGPAKRAALLKQLLVRKLSEGGDVRDHLNDFFDTVDKLESMEEVISPNLQAIMLLHSLPSSYEGFRIAIETRDQLPSPEELKVKILEHNESKKEESGNDVVAMAAGQNNGGQRRRKNNVFKCFKCGKKGHKANVCTSKNVEKSRAKYEPSANSVDDTFAVSHTFLNVTAGEATTKFVNKPHVNKSWIIDSGCTTHLCGDGTLFGNVSEAPNVKLNLASGATAEVKGKGAVCLSTETSEGQKLIEFRDTLYVPDLRTNLVSVAKITDKNYKVLFEKNICTVYNTKGHVVMIAERRGDLYYLRESVECAKAASTQTIDSKLLLWHQRLGHLNGKDLVKLVHAGSLPNLNGKSALQLSHCEICQKGKMTALPFPKGHMPCKEILGIVHSDVVGPFKTESTGRAKYFVVFIDDCTRWCEVYFLKRKCGVFEAFEMYQQLVERQTGKKIKCLQSDNGREYCNEEFNAYLNNHGIKRRLTIPHTPQQNGVCERMNRTLLDMARCLLLQSGLSAMFWSEAVATACYVRNRCPTSSLDGSIPYERWTKKKNNVNYFKIFGSKVSVLNKNPSKDKLAPRSVEGVFVGYPRERKGFRVWIPNNRKLIEARDVKFREDTLSGHRDTCVLDDWVKLNKGSGVEDDKATIELSPMNKNKLQSFEENVDSPNEYEIRAPGRPALLRTGRRGRPRKVYRMRSIATREEDAEEETGIESEIEDDVFVGVAEVSVREALNSDVSNEWLDAIENEVTSLVRNDTWDIIQRKDNKNTVGCRFVLTNKYGPKGDIEKRKARLVAKGYSQKFGVNYHQTFAPVARLETMRLVLALAAQMGLKIWQFDVVTAYLNGQLEEEVLMKVPEMLHEMLKRIVSKNSVNSEVYIRAKIMLKQLSDGGNVCKLKRALYGLKQAGRQWYRKLSEKLLNIGLKSAKNEPCLFHCKRENSMVFVVVYVDDILIASNEECYVNDIKQKLSEDFEIKDMGLAKYCLGFEINQSENQIKLSQTGYIIGLLKQYGMESCNPVATPSEVNVSFGDMSGDNSQEKYPYRELIGALMYLSVATRPDIANTVSRLAQFVEEPRKCHWLAAKRVLRYLSGTIDIGLVYTKSDKSLIGYSDADWGGCKLDRRSYSGYVFLLGGSAISWKSQKQRTVALSSTEAEYVSLAEATKESLYLRSMMCELGLDKWANITLYVDNRGAECLAVDPVFHARTKHIDIKYQFVRECIEHEWFIIKHISTKEMIADVLTKPLPRVGHEKCRDGMGFGYMKII